MKCHAQATIHVQANNKKTLLFSIRAQVTQYMVRLDFLTPIVHANALRPNIWAAMFFSPLILQMKYIPLHCRPPVKHSPVHCGHAHIVCVHAPAIQTTHDRWAATLLDRACCMQCIAHSTNIHVHIISVKNGLIKYELEGYYAYYCAIGVHHYTIYPYYCSIDGTLLCVSLRNIRILLRNIRILLRNR